MESAETINGLSKSLEETQRQLREILAEGINHDVMATCHNSYVNIEMLAVLLDKNEFYNQS